MVPTFSCSEPTLPRARSTCRHHSHAARSRCVRGPERLLAALQALKPVPGPRESPTDSTWGVLLPKPPMEALPAASSAGHPASEGGESGEGAAEPHLDEKPPLWFTPRRMLFLFSYMQLLVFADQGVR